MAAVMEAEVTPGQGQQGLVDPLFAACLYLRRRDYDNAINVCSAYLEHQNSLDQAVWYVKTRALTEKVYIDETEMEEDSLGEQLLDDNKIAQLPRPGTSFVRPLTTASGGGSARPNTQSGRPRTNGFARPSTQSRGTLESGFRPGTSRPVTTASARFVRLGTASLVAEPDGPFINTARLDLRKYAARPALAKILFGYIFHVENNTVMAMELAALAHRATKGEDWWWRAQLGNCYYRLGLFRDADSYYSSALHASDMIVTYLLLGKVHIRLDQPNAALDLFMRGAEKHPGEINLMIGVARIHEALGDPDKSIEAYRGVVGYNASNAEAIACLGAYHFYRDHPEIALQYYRRLLQLGINSAEVWNNVGLCCFYAQQYDSALGCFTRALAVADDQAMADVWYNVSHVALSVGDVGLAYQALKLAVASDANHAEAYNNLGVIELFRGNAEQAVSEFATSAKLDGDLHEPLFNSGLLHYKLGDFQEGFARANKALSLYPDHVEAKELIKTLKKQFSCV